MYTTIRLTSERDFKVYLVMLMEYV